MVSFAQKMGYENIDEFIKFVAAKTSGKYRMVQSADITPADDRTDLSI